MLVIKKIKPLFSGVVTTKERYAADELKGSLIDPTKTQGALKEYQKVIAVGDMVRNVKVGDLVKINPQRYAVYKDKRQNSVVNNLEEYHNQIVGYDFPCVELESGECLFLQDRDIEYVVEEYSEGTPSQLIHPNNTIIS